jgi:hypothetical protein
MLFRLICCLGRTICPVLVIAFFSGFSSMGAENDNHSWPVSGRGGGYQDLNLLFRLVLPGCAGGVRTGSATPAAGHRQTASRPPWRLRGFEGATTRGSGAAPGGRAPPGPGVRVGSAGRRRAEPPATSRASPGVRGPTSSAGVNVASTARASGRQPHQRPEEPPPALPRARGSGVQGGARSVSERACP